MARDDTRVLQAIVNVQQTINKRMDKLEKKMGVGFEEVGDRLDKQGAQLAYLEDDAPTINEFN